ncbi:sigma-54-dependent transcriptional regulator [Alloiococcus sp. CFN-8]|uniref:sigma-54-dependent transcriptional regulator n=1 Tax=Alloiococcus sp. CFN-8 TaxID=3416081 RepID=UPI003CF27447
MRRIDAVYEKIKELYSEKGVSAAELAEVMKLERANVSKDLNRLHEEGRLVKLKGKPVIFALKGEGEEKNTTLDSFLKLNPSLYTAGEQAKAAILYPPKKMNMFILGDTGVGKSMFAELIHKYAQEMKVMDESAPFISFNCADYANNPNLLLGQIFGVKKGAYTGADTDKAGLVEKADEGILFLDEVHRLPPEGQEIFFTFIDTGRYRRLGETEFSRSSKVLIICATTENPESTLLNTFMRRIPMVINIPSLQDRSLEERFGLICQFFKEESYKLGKGIRVSVNSLKAFAGYNCPNNIGQLKSDIQLSCARAYVNFASNKKKEIKINTIDIPANIREGLYTATDHRKLWNKLIDLNARYVFFDGDEEDLFLQDGGDRETIYDMLEDRLLELKRRGISDEELGREMEKTIDNSFREYLNTLNRRKDIADFTNIIPEKLVDIIKDVLAYSEMNLGRSLSEKIYYGMAVHIANSIERIRQNEAIINPQTNKIRQEHSREFNIALNCLKRLERSLDITFPIDEASFLTMFLIYEDNISSVDKDEVKIIVVAHGSSTATSMAEATNKLLGSNYAIGINAPIDEKPQLVINRIKEFIESSGIKSDILFLVDMGSLTTFGEEVEEKVGNKTRTIPLVSTLHVIEATRRAILGQSLEEVYLGTLEVNKIAGESIRTKSYSKKNEKLAIVTICTTGEGGALAVKGLLEERLHYDKGLIDIIPIMFQGHEEVKLKLNEIAGSHKVISIISPFSINAQVIQLGLSDIVREDGIEKLQTIIDEETTYIKMGAALDNQLNNINGIEALEDIKEFNSIILEKLKLKVSTNILIGEAFHVACLMDRLKAGELGKPFQNKEAYINDNHGYFRVVKEAIPLLNSKYNIEIGEDDICRIVSFFLQK